MHPHLDHRPINDRDAATAADRQLLAGPRAAAAARALHTVAAEPDASLAGEAETARIVIEAATLNIDVDRVGETLHVFADRVELIDRAGRTVTRIPRHKLAAVKIRRRVRHATLTVASAEATITLKGVERAEAERVRDDLLGLNDAPAKASAALAQLVELADAGLLERKDLATKRAELVRARAHGPA